MTTASALELAAARIRLDLAGSAEAEDAATQALSQGYDSPALRRLAGSSTGPKEVTSLLSEALSELELQEPDELTSVRLLTREIAQEITDERVRPYEGAKRIWSLSSRLDHEVPELHPFVYAASEWEDRPEDRASFDGEIVAAARRYLSDGV